MTKARFSISLDEDLAARIRAVATERGEDVSALMARAATELVQREERKREIFADIDARIAAVESGEDITETDYEAPERHEADTSFWDDFFKDTDQDAA